MNKIILFAILISLVACTAKTEKRHLGSRIVEAVFIKDEIADGLVKYYKMNGKLESTSWIKNGKRNGTTIFFYPNGEVYDSLNYSHGLPEGKHYRYDTAGNLEFQDFFEAGKRVGEIYSYRKGKLLKYEFVDSNNILLYSSEYDDEGLNKGRFKSIININASEIVVNYFPKKHVKFYWLSPPMVNIEYSLGVADTVQRIDRNLIKFTRTGIVKDTLLPILNYPFCYYISAFYSDTANKFEKVYIQEF